jgi:hypothetical protein
MHTELSDYLGEHQQMSGDFISPQYAEFEPAQETERHPEINASVLERGRYADHARLIAMIDANNEAITQVQNQVKMALGSLHPEVRAQIINGFAPHWAKDKANFPLYAGVSDMC